MALDELEEIDMDTMMFSPDILVGRLEMLRKMCITYHTLEKAEVDITILDYLDAGMSTIMDSIQIEKETPHYDS